MKMKLEVPLLSIILSLNVYLFSDTGESEMCALFYLLTLTPVMAASLMQVVG